MGLKPEDFTPQKPGCADEAMGMFLALSDVLELLERGYSSEILRDWAHAQSLAAYHRASTFNPEEDK